MRSEFNGEEAVRKMSSRVHNHGPHEGPGLDCPERVVDGDLQGGCMRFPDVDPSVSEWMDVMNGVVREFVNVTNPGMSADEADVSRLEKDLAWKKPDVVNMPDPDAKLRQFGWTVTPQGCWEWNGGRTIHRGGYGQVRYDGRVWKAHRLAYVAWVGPLPEDHFVCHSCDNPPCINPGHLFAGTPADNHEDMVRKGRGRGGSMPGESHPLAVLTEPAVIEIRRRLSQGAGLTELAREYGVTKQAIRSIKIRKTWRHL